MRITNQIGRASAHHNIIIASNLWQFMRQKNRQKCRMWLSCSNSRANGI